MFSLLVYVRPVYRLCFRVQKVKFYARNFQKMYVYAFARIEMSQSFHLDPLAAEMKTKLSGKVGKKWC